MSGDILAQNHSDSSPLVITLEFDNIRTAELYNGNIPFIQSERAERQAAILVSKRSTWRMFIWTCNVETGEYTNERAQIASLTQLGCRVTISIAWQCLTLRLELFIGMNNQKSKETKEI